MQASLIASSHYLAAMDDDAHPPLAQALRAAGAKVPRRGDRFTQLALLGAARCVAGQELATGCGLYFSSGMGPIESTVQVQQQLLRDHLWPKPVHFVNTLGSAAGFHLAAALNIRGPVQFVRGSHGSLLAAIQIALLDLVTGAAPMALVGAVEQAPSPLAGQRRRLGVPEDTPLAEGSHWLLMAPLDTHAGARNLCLQPACPPSELCTALLQSGASPARIAVSPGVSTGTIATLQDHGFASPFETRSLRPFHASHGAAWLCAALADDPSSPLWWLSRNNLLELRS